MRNPEERHIGSLPGIATKRRRNIESTKTHHYRRSVVYTFSLEALAPLLGHVPSSASRGELCLLDSYRVLEASQLGHPNLDLGLSLRLSMGQFFPRPLGSLQFPTQVLHLSLCRF